MLIPDDLTKLAKNAGYPMELQNTDNRSPVRKAVDAATNGAKAAVGGAMAVGQGIASLNNPAPVKRID